MNPSELKELIRLKNLGVKAALEAGAILRKYYGKKIHVSRKTNSSLVTNADLQAEQAIIRVLKRGTPGFAFLAEESGATESKNKSDGSLGQWIIDPLDGTTNFVHGFPMFCVSIGALWNGYLSVGVIYHPILDELYWAIRGKGAYLGKKRIHVSRASKLSDSLLTTGFFVYQQNKGLHSDIRIFERLTHETRAIRRPGSAALDLAYTARGVFDGFWERKLSPWDLAAGALLVEEAGGKVTNYQGDHFQLLSGEILAAPKKIHPALVREINRAKKPPFDTEPSDS